MAAGRTRCTRKLRSWIVEQVSSGKYPGLVWDDESESSFRIPWKHAGKQDFRKDEDAAIFKAWAQFKGKLTDDERDNPASWKTRLRCALNKSLEFQEAPDRAQLDISEPYKVYRLVPVSEQGLSPPDKKSREKKIRKSRRRKRSSSGGGGGGSDNEEFARVKQIKTEDVTFQQGEEDALPQSRVLVQKAQSPLHSTTPAAAVSGMVEEIRLDVRIEESVPGQQEVQDSFGVAVHYLGHEVLRRQIHSADVRVTYLPASQAPPTPVALKGRFPRVHLPEPPRSLPAGAELQGLLTLLPFMEKGVVLTSMQQGVYACRFCQGRVYWTGPHSHDPTGLHKMERNAGPVLLFSRNAFKQQLDDYCTNGGDRPQCGFTLCFGEELSQDEDLAKKLIIVQITLPWAEQQLQNAESLFQSIHFLQSLASQSPTGEITLDLVAVPQQDTCGTPEQAGQEAPPL